ncbi:glycolate oxidase subunit GlcE [Variovorax sp. KK3]|uniref:glycolate oxidase subunit GlcE n=1 Tax=Variovorax sp. KK3 TaxID=1855728 RepID=UPI00097C6257|nr:glycolate oxidase subunit GlcE [Variovorax sp. KK3]
MDPALRQISERIRAAAADRTLLRIRGGGTKDFYGQPPQGEELSTKAWQGIVSYEPSELVVTVRGGTEMTELDVLMATVNQTLAFEPPRLRFGSTVGGMVAAGLSGPARASVGALRDYVLGVQIINGRGELLQFGGTVMKNVAGYDVSRLMAGSMGTLGVITEVSLKVLPTAPAEATLVFDCDQADALRLLNSWGGQPLPLNASRWCQERGVGRLWLRLRGAAAAVDAACKRLGGERQDEFEARDDWDSLRDMRLPWFDAKPGRSLWRVSVPQTAPVLPFDGAPLVEWHGGQRWYFAGAGDGERLRAAARTVGGHATLFAPAADIDASVPRFDALPTPLRRINEALMREFDPDAVFDRGRLLQSVSP